MVENKEFDDVKYLLDEVTVREVMITDTQIVVMED